MAWTGWLEDTLIWVDTIDLWRITRKAIKIVTLNEEVLIVIFLGRYWLLMLVWIQIVLCGVVTF